MALPGVSSTDVLGYHLFINDANSNAVPQTLAYDGSAISNVLQVTVNDLTSGNTYWIAYKVLNRAGWSDLSPVLQLVSGKLP
jgi:hypothetical protein